MAGGCSGSSHLLHILQAFALAPLGIPLSVHVEPTPAPGISRYRIGYESYDTGTRYIFIYTRWPRYVIPVVLTCCAVCDGRRAVEVCVLCVGPVRWSGPLPVSCVFEQ